MSYLKPNTAGVYDIPAINASRELYIRGIPFEAYIDQLVFEDQFEQAEITELKLLVQYLNTSGLSSEWIIDNNNKNQDLKTTIDSLSSSVGTLDGKTRYVSSVQGNNSAPKLASDFQVTIGDRDKRSIYLTTGSNFISCINDSTNQGTPGNYADNQIELASVNGMITTTANMNRVEGTTVEITGPLGMGVQSDTTIKIGQGGSQIKIGSEDTPQLFPESNTVVTIGKRSATRNTETYLRGNMFLSDARFEDLAKSEAFTWQNFLALISTPSMPAWVASAILTSLVPNYVYSDLWSLKGNVTKDGDVETTTNAKLKGLTIFDPEINIDILPKIQTWLAKGDISETTLLGSIRAQTFNGEILLRNNNILATNINWALTDAMDKVNALKISNNDIELIAGAGAVNSQLRISNTTGGKIRIRAGTNTGLQADAHDALSIFSDQASTQVVIAGGDAPSGYDTTSKLLVDHRNLNNGIKVTNHQNALITRVDHNNINTPSLTLQSSWNGSTVKSLYLNANDELYYNGAKVNTGGGASGGITYYVTLAASISPPASPPLEQTMTTTYTARPQQTITQVVSANTAYYLADYVTEVFNKIANPILSGVQQVNQYARWNSVSHIGYLYGKLWYQATSPINNILWSKSYTSPVTTSYATALNGTPIVIPNGIYNLVFPRIIFTGIDIQPTSGQTAQLSCRLEVRPVSTGVFEPLINYGGATINFASNTLNQTITFSASTFTHNQTTNTPVFHNAIRMVLTCSNGTIRQTTAGAATDAAAYRLESNGATTAFIRVLLKDGSSIPIIIPTSTIPVLTELDLPIDTPYDIAAFNYSTLSTDVYFIQPTGGFGGHDIRLFFNEGTITHFHSTIAQTGAVSDVLAGTNIAVTANLGAYTISNAAPVQNVTSTGNIGVAINSNVATITNTAPTQSVVAGTGISVSTNNFISTINNAAPVQDIQAGTGITVSIASGTATISAAPILGSGGGTTSDGTNALITESTIPARKASWYGNAWSSFATGTHMFMDTYVSATGKQIVYATRANTTYQSGPVVSNNYGTMFVEMPATNGRVHREWATVCGLPTGNKIWVVSNRVTSGGNSVGFNQIWSTVDLFTTMTQEAAPAAFSNNDVVVEIMRVSADGKYMLMTHISYPNSNLGNIFKSSNYGASWSSLNVAGTLGWARGCAMSADGRFQFITIDGTSGGARADTGSGGVYRSTDFGDTWTRVLTPVNSAQIRRVECNGTGQIVIIADCAETRISYNYGVNWVATTTTITNSRCAVLNSAGNIIWFACADGTLYISEDFGREFRVGNTTPISWSAVSIASIAMNNEGSIIFAGNINETRRISYREPVSTTREVLLLDTNVNGLTIDTSNPGVAMLNLAPPLLKTFNTQTANIGQGGAFTIQMPTSIDLRDYNVSIRFCMSFTGPSSGFGTYTIFQAFPNDQQAANSNKSLWLNTIHTNGDFTAAENYAQCWTSPVFGYAPIQTATQQVLTSEMEISFASTYSFDTTNIIFNQFRTCIGQNQDNVAIANNYMYQQQNGTIQTANIGTNYILSNVVIRQYGTVTRAYYGRADVWIKKRNALSN